jgi:hypothetical protein
VTVVSGSFSWSRLSHGAVWGTGAAIPIEVAKTPSAKREILVELRVAWFKILTVITRSSSVLKNGI